ncbi:MAG: putative DNA-binding domain-containing protein [Paludibacterium sp.]|uniref:HvfC/BufC N-terminal domain-containing protein n=1 Tax=Paludibacterium sp. TaxID=1917523 RepID=UPI0025EE995A|nr:DNA-binding domain-containing protein [Paludibacterium sp.]MBV8048933.1 putative DNA-binding domain-containing protein [Paludibacterium sp.]MBV8647793.1 putative DNA-binding domain-containing protein [Paludibacterium sp.]
MPSLRELQTAFAAAVFGQDPTPFLAGCAGDPARAERAFRVYRDSVLSNLSRALSSTYPVIERIVGAPFLHAAARRYAQERPSRSGDLNDYGGDFADFLGCFAPAATLPYLPDVARLEWAIHQVGAAADAPPADLSLLAATDPAHWGALCLTLAPAHAVLASSWPLYDIWHVNQANHRGSRRVNFRRQQCALVSRGPSGMAVTVLSPGDAAVVAALGAGRTLLDAVSTVPDAAGLDLQRLLTLLIGQGLIVRVWREGAR